MLLAGDGTSDLALNFSCHSVDHYENGSHSLSLLFHSSRSHDEKLMLTPKNLRIRCMLTVWLIRKKRQSML